VASLIGVAPRTALPGVSQARARLAWAERYVPDAGEPRTEIATQLVDLVDTAPGLAAVGTSYAAATYYAASVCRSAWRPVSAALTRRQLISWLASAMASLASS